MKKSLVAIALCTMVGVCGFYSLALAEDKAKSTKEVMKLVHDEDGIKDTIGEQLKAAKPDWAVVSKNSKEWVTLATDMTKNKPKKGSAESWEKLAGKWLTDAKALDAAAEKKDVAAANKAMKALGSSCKMCHQAHKGK